MRVAARGVRRLVREEVAQLAGGELLVGALLAREAHAVRHLRLRELPLVHLARTTRHRLSQQRNQRAER